MALGLVALLMGCAQPVVFAPQQELTQARYVSNEPPYIALVTNVNTRSGSGDHSALIINGSERVVFNPAGTWLHPKAPERNDVHYGFSEGMRAWFIDYHARETYRVEIQRINVSRAVADRALAAAEQAGPVGPARCTLSITDVLRQTPGFEDFPRTLFPNQAKKAFAAYPGVSTEIFTDDSPGDRSDLDGKAPRL
ncbi:MAG: hypothetical protein OIF40_08895 [Mangrovicoccus sp.]|nr:hypothetical protein [Mangrovicoccus sp.]